MSQLERHDWTGLMRRYGIVVTAYVCATWFTDAYNMGDTVHYANSILVHMNGVNSHYWDFGHLFWRPLGYVCYLILNPLTNHVLGADARLNITLILIGLGWVSGLIGVIVMSAFLRLFCQRTWVVNVVTLAFIFANAYLDYFQTGCPYVPGDTLLLLGLFLMLKDAEGNERSLRASVLGGVALAGSVSMWFPYVLSLPAALVSPLLLYGIERKRLRLVVSASLACGVCIALAYLCSAIFGVGVRDVAGMKAWYADSSHGITNMGGVPRAVFGFARSLINMGDDGRVLKRYLLHDPFNHVSLFDLLRLSLWKFFLFYILMLAVFVALLRTDRGRRLLALFVLSAVPLFIFAIFLFDAGQIERYMPLYPLLFLSLGYALCSEKTPRYLKYVMLLYIVCASLTNLAAMRTSVVARQREASEGRLRDLRPYLKPGSKVATSHLQDELVNYNNNFLFDPINQVNLTMEVVEPNTRQVLVWRQYFAKRVLATWDAGNDVWLAKRLLAPRPKPDWNWVEGDDKNVSWTDLYNYFSPLETGTSVGGEDGFVLLLPSDKNRQILNGYVQ